MKHTPSHTHTPTHTSRLELEGGGAQASQWQNGIVQRGIVGVTLPLALIQTHTHTQTLIQMHSEQTSTHNYQLWAERRTHTTEKHTNRWDKR